MTQAEIDSLTRSLRDIPIRADGGAVATFVKALDAVLAGIVTGGTAGVTSFGSPGRSGIVTPIQADYDSFFLTQAEGDARYALIGTSGPVAWSSITGTPTSLSGYGITPVQADYDSFFLTPAEGNAAYASLSHTHAFSSITGTPTTLAGYGITDAYTKVQSDALYQPLGSYEVPLTFVMSVSRVAGNQVKLVNDMAVGSAPGTPMAGAAAVVYGIDAAGAHGFFSPPPTGGAGTLTSISHVAPIVLTPNPITGTGTIGLDVGVDHAFTAAQSILVSDNSPSTTLTALTLTRDTTAGPSLGLGTEIAFYLESTVAPVKQTASIRSSWSVATDASRSSVLEFYVYNTSGHLVARMHPSGSLVVGGITTDAPAASMVCSGAGGFAVGVTSPTLNKFLLSDGVGYKDSGYTLPTPVVQGDIWYGSSSTALARLPKSGTATRYLANTAASNNPQWDQVNLTNGVTGALPTANAGVPAGGATGYTLKKTTGTDYATAFKAANLSNGSITQQTFTATVAYLAGSAIQVTAGDWVVAGGYYCAFDIGKTAGTGTLAVEVRVGTTGTVSDTVRCTLTFGAQTAVTDFGTIEVWANWRVVGASSILQAHGRLTHGLATTGLNTNGWNVTTFNTSSAASSSAATTIGISFSGGTSFAGTTQVVQTLYNQ